MKEDDEKVRKKKERKKERKKGNKGKRCRVK